MSSISTQQTAASSSSSSTQQSQPFLLGGFELGGTTIKVCLAQDSVTNVIDQRSFPTDDPAATVQKAVEYFRSHRISALGVGSFGPVDLNTNSKSYGHITTTPKLKWQDYDVLGPLRVLNVPMHFTTDVNAAALGELKWGEHGEGVTNCAYITVGTGIGAGVVTDNRAVSGALHPEAGHFFAPRHPDDKYAGNCPFHKDCIEGLANAAAVAARCGVHPSQLHTIPDSHPVWDIEAFYLAHLCLALSCIVSPHVIVLGGGVLKRTCLFPKTREQFLKLMNGYLRVDRMSAKNIHTFIVPSRFDASGSKTSAGCIGVLELARRAAEEKKEKSRL
jgi:fructokinase